MSERWSGEAFEDRYDPLSLPLYRGENALYGTLDGRSGFLERYFAGEVGIYALVRSRIGDEWVAVCHWTIRPAEGDLVDSVEVVENPEWVTTPRLVPMVRLFVLDEVAGGFGDTVQTAETAFPRTDQTCIDLLPLCRFPAPVDVPDNGEHQRFFYLRGQRPKLTFGERVNRVIERGSEVLDGIPNEQAKLRGRGSLDLRPSDCVSRLGIYLTVDGVGICPEPGIDAFIGSFYVFAAAIQFQPRVGQPHHGVTST